MCCGPCTRHANSNNTSVRIVAVVINPRRTCAATVTVVVLCVCVSCLSAHAILVYARLTV